VVIPLQFLLVQQLQILEHKQVLGETELLIGKHQLKHLVLQQYLVKDIFVIPQGELLQLLFLLHQVLVISWQLKIMQELLTVTI
jgi:hypothetical protein